MPSQNPKNLFEFIQTELNLNALGMLWFTDKPLEQSEDFFYQIDYLFDGIISKFIYNYEKGPIESSFFIGEHYDKPFFLAHMCKDISDMNKQLKSFLTIMNNRNEGRKKIITLSHEKINFSKEIKKIFPNFEFIEL